MSSQRFLEFRAGHYVVVALAPGCAVVRMIHGNGLEFGIIVRKVNDEFGQSGLQVLNRSQVEILPVGGGDAWVGDDDRVWDDVFVRESEASMCRRSIRIERTARNGSLYS